MEQYRKGKDMTDLFKQRIKDYLEQFLDFSTVPIVDGYIPDVTIQSGIKVMVDQKIATPEQITSDLLFYDVILPVHTINEWVKDKSLAR